MTQTTTPASWTTSRRDKYGRPFVHLMATVIKDGDDKARWQVCAVLTTLPKTVGPEQRYMLTNWMAAPFVDGVRQDRVEYFAKRAQASARAMQLLAEQQAKTPAIEQAAEAAESALLWV